MLRNFCLLLLMLSPSLVRAVDRPGVTGTIEHHEGFAAKELLPRNIDVWLPPSYDKDPARRYPVVYMHDGQNLFDPAKSFIGVDWGVDEAMTQLIADGKIREAIVVGIWNTPHRNAEYVPEKPLRNYAHRETVLKDLSHGNTTLAVDDLQADKYLKLLVTELKPFIDKTYRAQSGRDETFIMGSSAGALISLYAICEYPHVFGGAGSVSGHYPLGDGMLVDALRDELPDPRCHKLYFDFGTETLDKSYEPYQWQMDAAVAEQGYTRGCNWLTCKFAGAEHSERAWRARVDIPLQFFLRKDQGRVYPRHWWAAVDDPNKPSWEILPQEAKPGEVILSKRNELGLLSNFAATPFTFRGKRYASLEGFWQAMKYPEGPDDPRSADPNIEWKFDRDEVAKMTAFEAKEAGDMASVNMRKLGIDWVSFDGRRFPYRPKKPGEHYDLIVAATKAKVCQNAIVSSVLLSTGDMSLKPDHHQEADSPAAWRYHEILMGIRAELSH
jgi:predicted alpha/beta superfamily hydrolase